ncbi:MAG: sodium/proline symporter PutP [Deferribacterales bacterium]|nr:sodium/proline symporter PutP [Deferribacterales bacterium]
MINGMTYITFIVYFIALAVIGIYFYTKSKRLEDYLLGGRGMGSWVTALSAQASDMSGWLLMGLPGAIYLAGISESWIAIGLILGTFLNWIFIAARLRLYTAATGALTMSSFFDKRFKDPTNLLRIISSIVTLLFFTVYAASGLVGMGKLFETMFNMNYVLAVLIGTGIMVFYTLLGGFMAVCWTDLLQGLLMVFAIVILPFLVYNHIEPGALAAAFEAKGTTFNLMPEGSLVVALLAILSSAAWGFGYFGQPHILVRFMSVKSVKILPRSITIAMIWVVISLVGAVVIGLLGMPLYQELKGGDHEKVLIFMVRDFVNPYFAGVVLAAILAAIMSTISSQLLVSSSTLSEDIYANIINKKASDKQLLFINRVCVLLIFVISFFLAMDRDSNIFSLVSFAWGGFGSAFGPVIIMALYSKKTTWYSALAGMITGTVVMLCWYAVGWGAHMYEIVPGFFSNLIVILLVNQFWPNKDEEINAQFDAVKHNAKIKHTPGVDD